MSRIIKFRVWDRKLECFISEPFINSNGVIYTSRDCVESDICASDVNEKIDVMQYTGLKDKNGKEVYEGDLLKLTEDDKDLVVVSWNKETCAFCAQWDDNKSDHLYGVELGEVIGNIHENKELLDNAK